MDDNASGMNPHTFPLPRSGGEGGLRGQNYRIPFANRTVLDLGGFIIQLKKL